MESRKITVAYCPVCKNELIDTDVLTICDGCLFSLDSRENASR